MINQYIPFASEHLFTVRYDEGTKPYTKNTLLEYSIVGNTLVLVNPENITMSVVILGNQSDTLNLMQEVHDRELLRVDLVDEKKRIMELNLLVYNAKTALTTPLTIIVDDAILPALHKFNIEPGRAATYFSTELLLKDRANPNKVACFTIGRERLELVSSRISIEVETSPTSHYLHVVDIKKSRNRPSGILQMLTGEITITDQRSVQAEQIKQSNEIYASLVKDNNELIKLWQAYNECEITQARLEANELGYIRYSNWNMDAGMLVFQAYKGSSVSQEFVKDDLLYEAISPKDYNPDDDPGSKKPSVALGVADIAKSNSNQLVIYPDDSLNLNTIPSEGYIRPSVRGSEIQANRRDIAQRRITSGRCDIPQLKILLQSGQPVGQAAKRRLAVTTNLEQRVFDGDKTKHLNEKQKAAIDAAINTPDVAIIQGPPGTGKTKVIRAIVERIHELENGRAHILISSTQHDAVDTAIEDITYNGVPANRAYNRKKTSETISPIYAWIDDMTDQCYSWLEKHSPSSDILGNEINDLLTQLPKTNGPSEIIEKLHDIFIQNQFQAATIALLDEYTTKQNTSADNNDDEILARLFTQQRIDKTEFLQDGSQNLRQLVRFIRNDLNQPELIPSEWRNLSRIVDDCPELDDLLMTFSAQLVEVKATLLPQSATIATSFSTNTYNQLLEAVNEEMASRYSKKSDTNETYQLISTFMHELTSAGNVKDLIKSYSMINAATCQQSASRGISEAMKGLDEHYDYVIIDEAARSNPLDLMIPMIMGKRIILVGDHKQLPHMLDEKIVNQVVRDHSGDQTITELLKESLFVRLFNLMEKADQNQTERVKRVVMLTEQRRMHPDICQVVSELFYDNQLTSGCSAEEKTHHIDKYKGHALAWVDVPASANYPHETKGKSKSRKCEVEVIENILLNVLSDESIEKIGVISFYRAQTELLHDLIDSNFADKAYKIQVGTVDSFQGKEFDVVILSAVRSNDEPELQSRVGFLDDNNRINVAFSRAKKLLIMVGDSKTITVTKPLKKLFDVCNEKGGKGYYECIC